MSKRIVSLLLIFAMLVTLFSVTATAAEEIKVNGEPFTAVKTEAELAAALRDGKNVILENDIELTSENFPQGKKDCYFCYA